MQSFELNISVLSDGSCIVIRLFLGIVVVVVVVVVIALAIVLVVVLSLLTSSIEVSVFSVQAININNKIKHLLIMH